MNRNPKLVVLDVTPWYVELQYMYKDRQPHNPLEFGFEDFSMLLSSITDVAFCPIGQDRPYMLQHAIDLFSEYCRTDCAVILVNRYIEQLNSQLTHAGTALLPALNPGYRSWVTSNNHLYISYENNSILVQPEYTRSELLASIENGDFINERTRREYGL